MINKEQLSLKKRSDNKFSRINLKLIDIIRTGSHPYEKVMSSIVLHPVFYEYKNVRS